MTRALAAASLLALAVGCGSTEGPLLVAVGQDAGSTAQLGDAGSTAQLGIRRGMSFQYQLQGDVDVSVDAELFVIDLFDAPREQVAALHASQRVVVAYFSAGSFEPWRDDASSFPRDALGAPLSDYPDELWLDVRNGKVRSLMQARLELAREKGFDGVLPGALGAYLKTTGFSISESEQLDYDRFVFSEARARGLTPGLSDEPELADELADAVDWGMALGCLDADNCGQLDALIALKKPVFNVEKNGRNASICALATARGLPTILKQPSYDAWRSPCP